MSIIILSGTVVIFLIASIVLHKWIVYYWRIRKLPCLEPRFPFGRLLLSIKRKENLGITIENIYKEIKRRKWHYGGVYFTASPTLVIVNLDHVKNIMKKDFHHFVDRGSYYNEKNDPLSAHLFHLNGTKWKNLRMKLTPTFTSAKMKMMFQTLIECEAQLQEKIKIENGPINIKTILECFTLDVIGSCAFGLDLNKMNKSLFRMFGRKGFELTHLQTLKAQFCNGFPFLAKSLNMCTIPKDVSNFFEKIVEDTVCYRCENDYRRNDFLQLLIDLKRDGVIKDAEMAAQCYVFFLAGFETSATTMTFVLYELAKNQDIQSKVRNEIDTVLGKYGGKLTFGSIQDLKYLDQVINETLRKYPPLPYLTRKCVQDYKIHNDKKIIIEKGTTILVSIRGIHHDEEYYPNPDKFDPERFNEENKQTRHHFAHIPFGEGPRMCIGMRFGIMQTKTGLTSLLQHYKFMVNMKTKEPITMKPYSVISAAEGEIWLDGIKL